LAACASPAGASERIKIATWNLEWLMTPEMFRALAPRCTHEGESYGDERSIPCDVAQALARRDADYAKLREYAQRLDADVIALQEVDGASAARLVLPDYDFCFTARRNVQNNGIAIRRGRGIHFRCEADVRELGLHRGRVRYGVVATLWPGEKRQLVVLGVHLKSGCAGGALTRPDEACELLIEQVPILEHWIEDETARGTRFVIAGDFNRRFGREHPPSHDRHGRLVALWPEITQRAALVDAAAGTAYAKCRPSEHYNDYIDHIVASASAAARLERGSLSRVAYSESDARMFKLSDHCPLAVDYRVEP
jgi:endonuclease/exonuclease/phosphatase family metal-dependent hydrolase